MAINHFMAVQITVIIAAMAPFFIIDSYAQISFGGTALIFISLMLMAAYSVIGYVEYQYRKIAKYLMRDCDPERYVAAYSYIIKKTKNTHGCRYSHLLVNLSTGLIIGGRYDEALSVLNGCTIFDSTQTGRRFKMVYCNNLSVNYQNLGHVERAAEQLNAFKVELDRLKIGSKAQLAMRRLYDRSACAFRMVNGDYDGAEDMYLEQMKRADSNYARVSAQFALGKDLCARGADGQGARCV